MKSGDIVDSLIGESLTKYMEFNPGVFDLILKKQSNLSTQLKQQDELEN